MSCGSCCEAVGRLGIAKLDRTVTMSVCAGLGVCGLAFCLACCAGLSSDLDVIKDVQWANYHTTEMRYYLDVLGIRSESSTGVIQSSALHSLSDEQANQLGVRRCKDISAAVAVMVVLATVSTPLQICAAVFRVVDDANRTKVLPRRLS